LNYLSNSNSKLAKDKIFTFGIPAGKYTVTERFVQLLGNQAHEYKPGDVIVTCPNAGACSVGCYAMQGFYVMPSVKRAQEERLAAIVSSCLDLKNGKRAAFIDAIDAEIKRRKVTRLRIHDSGDFFNAQYTSMWLTIARNNPHVKFYAYTKMVSFFKARAALLPANFHVIYSEGGTQDKKINQETDRHSRVFATVKELKKAKYSDAHERDYPALAGKLRVGLVYHGAPSRQWVTA
jgi:hypothetical protein